MSLPWPPVPESLANATITLPTAFHHKYRLTLHQLCRSLYQYTHQRTGSGKVKNINSGHEWAVTRYAFLSLTGGKRVRVWCRNCVCLATAKGCVGG